ncbi:MAG TPA: hypothetical protein PLC98_13640 [Anaerolineales bacterium]|nr:hypothetical protein [Anaerolineales bacterium]
MKPPSSDDIRTLLTSTPAPGVSLFAPNRRAGTQALENRTQLRNLVRQAEGALASTGLTGDAIRALLAPAQTLIDDRWLWRRPPAGLALFMCPDGAQMYSVDFELEPQVIVGHRYHVKPLWPLVAEALSFFVLALSQKSARLFRGDAHGLTEILADTLPHDIGATLRHDIAPSAQVRLHSAGPVGVGGRRGAVAFHGAASNEEPLRDEQLHFCQRVDAALTAWLPAERPPLVLAGVRFLLDLYRQVSRYPALVDAEIDGNVDRWEAAELHATAWDRLAPERGAGVITALAEVDRLSHTGRVTTDLRRILPAALQGRVGRLLMAHDRSVWGRFDPDPLSVHIDGVDAGTGVGDDLLDVAAGLTWLNGGAVHSLPQGVMPGKALCAAVLRF